MHGNSFVNKIQRIIENIAYSLGLFFHYFFWLEMNKLSFSFLFFLANCGLDVWIPILNICSCAKLLVCNSQYLYSYTWNNKEYKYLRNSLLTLSQQWMNKKSKLIKSKPTKLTKQRHYSQIDFVDFQDVYFHFA